MRVPCIGLYDIPSGICKPDRALYDDNSPYLDNTRSRTDWRPRPSLLAHDICALRAAAYPRRHNHSNNVKRMGDMPIFFEKHRKKPDAFSRPRSSISIQMKIYFFRFKMLKASGYLFNFTYTPLPCPPCADSSFSIVLSS